MAKWPWDYWYKPGPRPEVSPEEWALLEDQRREREQQQALQQQALRRRQVAAAQRRELGQRTVQNLNQRQLNREIEMVGARRRVEAERLAEEQADALRRQERIPDATVVVICITAAIFFMSAIRGASGAGVPDRGDEFRRLSARLNDDVSGMLSTARPTAWSGAPRGAAYHYDRKITEQQARVDAVAAADHQMAAVVATQASQVEQGCQALDAILLALGAGIMVAVVLDAQWKAAVAAASPAAPALEAALLAFGTCLVCGAVMAAIGVLTALLVAGQETEEELDKVIGDYQRVIGDAAAEMPTAQTATVEVSSSASTSAAAGFSDLPNQRSDAQRGGAGARTLIDSLLSDGLSGWETAATLGELAELFQQATKRSGYGSRTSTPETAHENPSIAEVPWLAALAQPAAAANLAASAAPAGESRLNGERQHWLPPELASGSSQHRLDRETFRQNTV